jgi:hypothetical protein
MNTASAIGAGLSAALFPLAFLGAGTPLASVAPRA